MSIFGRIAGRVVVSSALALVAVGCVEERDDSAVHIMSPDEEAVELASFELSNGNTIIMIGMPESGAVHVGETAPAGRGEQLFLDSEPRSPLAVFVTLAPQDAPVPQMLADLSDADERAVLLREREVVAEVDGFHYYVDIGELGWTPAVDKSGGGSCSSTTGAQYFADNHCGTMGPYGYGVTETDCDNGQWWNLQRSSAAKMKHTYTRIAACNGPGRMRHSRKKVSGWNTHLDVSVPANSVTSWYSYYKSAIRYYRRANFDRSAGGSAYVRGWTRYFDNVVSNAP